jgi:hypothetical protein
LTAFVAHHPMALMIVSYAPHQPLADGFPGTAYHCCSGRLLAVTLPDDKRPQERQPLGDLLLLGVKRHALIVGGRLKHLIASVLHAQTFGDRAAFNCPLSASPALGYGN